MHVDAITLDSTEGTTDTPTADQTTRSTKRQSQSRPIQRFHRILNSIPATVLVAVCIAGTACANPAADPKVSTASPDAGFNQPDVMRYIINWSGQSVLDLMSADATFIRAVHESAILANYAGGADDAYPGFDDAISPEIEESFYTQKWPNDHVYGKEFNRIVEIAELDGNKVEALVCQVRPHLFPESPITTPPKPGQGSVSAFRIVYQREGKPPPEDQHGNRAVPHGSVFGDWQAMEYEPHLETRDPESATSCLSANYTPQDTDSPVPGWPANPQPTV